MDSDRAPHDGEVIGSSLHLVEDHECPDRGDNARRSFRPRRRRVESAAGLGPSERGALEEAAVGPERFEIKIEQPRVDDLQRRLEHVRWPIDVANDDWRYGAQRAYLEELVAHWRTDYDWREHERRINTYANFRTTIDDVPIHFIHERGVGPAPIPLILSHGWPWTFWDFEKVIRPLTDPAAFGGDPADAFDVVVPSLPGFGFSVPLTRTGINFQRTADLWVTLMRDVLGYDEFAAQGGDWGHLVSAQIGHALPRAPDRRAPQPGDADGPLHRAAAGRGGLRGRRAALLPPHAVAHGARHDPRGRPEHRPADRGLRVARLAGRPAGLARRPAPLVERLRRRRRAAVLQGRPHHAGDALLGRGELRHQRRASTGRPRRTRGSPTTTGCRSCARPPRSRSSRRSWR